MIFLREVLSPYMVQLEAFPNANDVNVKEHGTYTRGIYQQ